MFRHQPPNPLGAAYHPKDLVVRVSRDDAGLAGAIRDIVRRVDPNQPISNVRMLAEVVGNQTGTRRAQLRVLIALAVLALLITAAGIHGLLGFTVAQRDREIGVRRALGAERSSVARMISLRACASHGIGVGLGHARRVPTARGMTLCSSACPRIPAHAWWRCIFRDDGGGRGSAGERAAAITVSALRAE